MMFESALVAVRLSGEFPGDCELLLAARRFAPKVVALCLGAPGDALRLYGLCHECLTAKTLAAKPDALALARLLTAETRGKTLILMRHDSLGMDVGPGLATALGLPFVTNISQLEVQSQGLARAARFELSGQVVAGYEVETSRGALFTVMPGALPGNGDSAPVETRVRPLAETGAQREPGETCEPGEAAGAGKTGRVFLEEVSPGEADADIVSASVLVAVGRGMQSGENVAAARRLAALLGGELCCSRAAADAGWLEKGRQVGISGQSVSPAVYVALGLHGAFQHMLGLRGIPYVVAVNTNPDAPIFRHAAVGVVTDAPAFASLLADALEKKKMG